ncbi:MAG TPA: carbon-nitrogen hydrolase family protein [Gammaproteobacteria bacterium]|nr:carbon-nitrogen hydrolase family protein [Gammaproteobacteria bacterium]
MKRVAAVQMASGPNIEANLIEAGRSICAAADAGAGLIVLPENFALMGLSEKDNLKFAEKDGIGKIQDFLAEKAEQTQAWIVGGTIPIAADEADKVNAACLVFDDKGRRVARYDKIHLFDVEIVDSGEQYAESMTIKPGNKAVVIDSPFGKLGLAVCYDLRFPELFRTLLDKGAEIFVVPSAFTAITGRAHWEVIVRARAIENLSYVVAAAQGGYHVSGRETYGDSMIVGPWGTVLDRLPNGSGFVIADIDKDRLASVRRNFPAIDHRKL